MMSLRIFAAGAAGIIGCASITMVTVGVAAADPDVVGKRYSDAKGVFSAANLTPVVATAVGDKLSQDQCFVVSTSQPTFLDQAGSSKGDLILVNLSCFPKPATANSLGFSAANNAPDAQAVRVTHEQESLKWKKTAEGQKWCAEAQTEHPEWGAIPGC
jgi:hypothetical protein